MLDPNSSYSKSSNIPKANTGIEKGGSKAGGGVETHWKDIKWTRNKLVGTTIALGLPYLIGIILTWMAGMNVITYILIGVAMLVGFIFLVVGWIDSNEF